MNPCIIEKCELTDLVIDKLKYYVYVLLDPGDKSVFYVGKGKGSRLFSHVYGEPGDADASLLLDDKKELISVIRPENVLHGIIRYGLDEATAFEVEAALIDFIGKEKLTNQVRGNYSYLRGADSIKALIQKYENKGKLKTDENMILININKTFRADMTEKEVIDITRSSWVMGKRREKAKYVLSVYRGTVIEVMKIDLRSWRCIKPNEENKKNRWEFEADIAEEDIRKKYLYTNVREYYEGGRANPIRYINC